MRAHDVISNDRKYGNLVYDDRGKKKKNESSQIIIAECKYRDRERKTLTYGGTRKNNCTLGKRNRYSTRIPLVLKRVSIPYAREVRAARPSPRWIGRLVASGAKRKTRRWNGMIFFIRNATSNSNNNNDDDDDDDDDHDDDGRRLL